MSFSTGCYRLHAYLQAIGGPATLIRGGVDVFLQLLRQPREVQKQVLGRPEHRPGACQLADGIYELCGVQEAAAIVALVPPSVLHIQDCFRHLHLRHQIVLVIFT